MNPYKILKEDHKKVKDLMKQIEELSEDQVSEKEELFEQLKHELEVHTQTEEKTLYPALKEKEETRDISLEAIEEHHVVDLLLKELDELSKDEEQWSAKFTVLKEMVEHHIEEEEEEMFKKAHQALEKNEENELGEEIETTKENLAA